MNDPDNFLSRWSRRKLEADAQPKAGDDKATAASGDEATNQEDNHSSSVTRVPEFDVSKLPPIETIGAGTDITAFMQAGVPSALRHAALRRAWSADPTVRDFVGLNENYWDAAGPEGIPGFGDLDPNLDVKRLISELFGETPAEKPQAEAPTATSSAEISDARETDDNDASETANISRPTENAAAQKESPPAQPPKRVARRHGGAMPQ
jgi:hypothetical protein